MASVHGRSADELSDLLDEYGIKHGPIVDSTRSLYEKKLREAMAKGKRAKPSPDKTYYREEEDEVTYVYRTPVRNEGSGDRHSGSYMRARPEWTERPYEQATSYSTYQRPKTEFRGKEYVDEPYMYDSPSTYRSSYLSSTPVKPAQEVQKAPKTSRLIPLWVQFVFFLALAVFLYIVFSSMETNQPMRGIE